jgi:hypothetical protein
MTSVQALPRLCRQVPHRVQQRCMSVPEPMPVHSSQFESLANWLELAIEQITTTEPGTVPGREHQTRWNLFRGLQGREDPLLQLIWKRISRSRLPNSKTPLPRTDPAFVEPKIGAVSSLGYLMYLKKKDPSRVQALPQQLSSLLKEAMGAAPDNPRLLWVLLRYDSARTGFPSCRARLRPGSGCRGRHRICAAVPP